MMYFYHGVIRVTENIIYYIITLDLCRQCDRGEITLLCKNSSKSCRRTKQRVLDILNSRLPKIEFFISCYMPLVFIENLSSSSNFQVAITGENAYF